jgi:hypothetical protein
MLVREKVIAKPSKSGISYDEPKHLGPHILAVFPCGLSARRLNRFTLCEHRVPRIMSPEWLARFPLIFDIVTGAVFVVGCLLLWLNLKPRAAKTSPMPNLHFDQEIQRPPPPSVDSALEPTGPSEFVAAPLTVPSQESNDAETESADAANSYASHVSSALSKFRKTKPADSGA